MNFFKELSVRDFYYQVSLISLQYFKMYKNSITDETKRFANLVGTKPGMVHGRHKVAKDILDSLYHLDPFHLQLILLSIC